MVSGYATLTRPTGFCVLFVKKISLDKTRMTVLVSAYSLALVSFTRLAQALKVVGVQCATKKVGRYREGAETRQRILDTALDLIASNGYSATSIAKISTAAGVQPASIYWAFGSKEGLLAAVMERAAERWFATELETVQTDSPSDLERALQHWTASISARPEFLRLMLVLSLERREGDPDILVAAQRVRKQARHALVRRLEQCIPIEDRVQRRANARQLAYLVMMLLDGVFVSRQVEPGDLSERQLVTIVSRAVRTSLSDMLTECTNEEVA